MSITQDDIVAVGGELDPETLIRAYRHGVFPWPVEGLPLLWEYDKCGKGYSSITTGAGLLFTAGDIDDKEYVIALDMDGRLKWAA